MVRQIQIHAPKPKKEITQEASIHQELGLIVDSIVTNKAIPNEERLIKVLSYSIFESIQACNSTE